MSCQCIAEFGEHHFMYSCDICNTCIKDSPLQKRKDVSKELKGLCIRCAIKRANIQLDELVTILID